MNKQNIMDSYIIVRSDYIAGTDVQQIKNLQDRVNILIAQGYCCVGGIVISFTDRGEIMRMFQTMVKY